MGKCLCPFFHNCTKLLIYSHSFRNWFKEIDIDVALSTIDDAICTPRDYNVMLITANPFQMRVLSLQVRPLYLFIAQMIDFNLNFRMIGFRSRLHAPQIVYLPTYKRTEKIE